MYPQKVGKKWGPQNQWNEEWSAFEKGYSKVNIKGILFQFFKYLCSIHQTDIPNLRWHILPRKNNAKAKFLKCWHQLSEVFGYLLFKIFSFKLLRYLIVLLFYHGFLQKIHPVVNGILKG